MKTAISVEDSLLRDADATARQMGVSRSGLFALAMAEFLRRKNQERILERLNEAYAGDDQSAEKELAKRFKARVRLPDADRW